jgi:hypothetical protein
MRREYCSRTIRRSFARARGVDLVLSRPRWTDQLATLTGRKGRKTARWLRRPTGV